MWTNWTFIVFLTNLGTYQLLSFHVHAVLLFHVHIVSLHEMPLGEKWSPVYNVQPAWGSTAAHLCRMSVCQMFRIWGLPHSELKHREKKSSFHHKIDLLIPCTSNNPEDLVGWLGKDRNLPLIVLAWNWNCWIRMLADWSVLRTSFPLCPCMGNGQGISLGPIA